MHPNLLLNLETQLVLIKRFHDEKVLEINQHVQQTEKVCVDCKTKYTIMQIEEWNYQRCPKRCKTGTFEYFEIDEAEK